jgi:hypothetical protein
LEWKEVFSLGPQTGLLRAVHDFDPLHSQPFAVSSDLTSVATIGADGVEIQNMGSNQTTVTIPASEVSEIYHLSLNHSGSVVAMASLDQSKLFLRLYDTATGVCLSENEFENEIQNMQFLPGSDHVIGVANARALYPLGFRESLFLTSPKHGLVVRNRTPGCVAYSGVRGFCAWSDSTFAKVDLRPAGFFVDTFNVPKMLCGAANDLIRIHGTQVGLFAVDAQGRSQIISSEVVSQVVLQHDGDLLGTSPETNNGWTSALNVYDEAGSLLWERSAVRPALLAVTSKYLVWAEGRDRIVRCDVKTGLNEAVFDSYPHYKAVASRDGQHLAIRLAPEGLALFDVERFVPVWEVRAGVRNITSFGVDTTGDIAIAFSDRAMASSTIEIWSDRNVRHSLAVAGCMIDLLWLDSDHLVVANRNHTCEVVRIVDGEVLDSRLLTENQLTRVKAEINGHS